MDLSPFDDTEKEQDDKMKRAIIWHCECGRDIEMDSELRLERCPFCGGSELERVKVPSRWSELFGDTETKSKR
jgi:DNA-directed RNA polymerase subunit RPC12/RpoP